jgi:hypothetical protein
MKFSYRVGPVDKVPPPGHRPDERRKDKAGTETKSGYKQNCVQDAHQGASTGTAASIGAVPVIRETKRDVSISRPNSG